MTAPKIPPARTPAFDGALAYRMTNPHKDPRDVHPAGGDGKLVAPNGIVESPSDRARDL